jgi:hypothetical protein
MNKFFNVFLIFFLPFLLFHSSALADVSQRRIFFDGFEGDLRNWQLTFSSPNSIEISSDRAHSGSKSLKFVYRDGSKYLAAIHPFPSQTNIVLRGWFYDDNSSQKGIAFCLKDTSTNSHTCLGVNTSLFPAHYFIRHNSFSNMYNTQIKRTQGWHLFEIIVLPSGAYAKIDNQFLALWKNTSHTKADSLEIWSTWALTGDNWFDDIDILTTNQNPEDELKSLIQRYLYLYRNTDFSPLYPDLGINCDLCTGDPKCCGRMHGNDIRSIMDLAYALIFDWKINNNQNSLDRAVQLVKDVVNYGQWNRVDRWSVGLPTSRLLRVSAMIWEYLPPDTKEKILLIGESLGNEFLNRQPASGYINDTRAEDNAWNAAFLSTISQFYNSHVNASLWEEKGKCFAWHSITKSTDPEFCGVKTQTVYDDFQLDNHNLHPNPVYTAATIHLLAEGAFPYHVLGKPVPQEFKHNVAPLFSKLLSYVTETFHYQVNGRPFADWSGATDSFYPWGGGVAVDFVATENLGSPPSKSEMMAKRSLFYADILSELTETSPSALWVFNQRDRSGDSYKFFLNSNSAETLLLSYFWNHPQGAFRSLKWQVQDQGKTWQPAVWSGGPLINYETQNNQLVFSLASQQPSNGEVYSSLIPVKPNTKYTISYKVKTENLQSTGQFPGAIIVSEYNQNAKETDKLTENRVHDGKRDIIPKYMGTNDWKEVKYSFVTTPNTKYVRLRMLNAGWGNSTGKVWFKEINFGEERCEENVYKVKIWEGSFDWACDYQTNIEGNSSIKFSIPNFSNVELYSPLIPVQPNQTYRVSYWVKTRNVEVLDAKVYGKVIVAQYYSSAKEEDEVNQNRIDPGFNLGENVGGTTDWTKKSYTFKTTPQTSFVRLRAVMGNGRVKGEVWFDGIKIERETRDLNQDGKVDGKDVKILLSKYLTQQIDLNSDGKTNLIDFLNIIIIIIK